MHQKKEYWLKTLNIATLLVGMCIAALLVFSPATANESHESHQQPDHTAHYLIFGGGFLIALGLLGKELIRRRHVKKKSPQLPLK